MANDTMTDWLNVDYLKHVYFVKCENEFFSFHKVVQRQFLGKAVKLLFAREQIMSGFCVPKIAKFGKFLIMLFKKNKNVDVFFETQCIYTGWQATTKLSKKCYIVLKSANEIRFLRQTKEMMIMHYNIIRQY